MATLKITDDDRKLVSASLAAFATYASVDGTAGLSVYPPLRRLQIEHARWQSTKLDPKADCSLPVLSLGIVEEACWELLEAVGADDRDETFDSLGDVLVYTCGVCTSLRLDFLVLSRDFDPTYLEQPEGLEGVLGLVKAIGMLAHVVVHHQQNRRGYDDIGKTRLDAGAAIAKICSAVHWLAFSNDWEPSVLFQEVITSMMKRNWLTNKLSGDVSSLHVESLEETIDPNAPKVYIGIDSNPVYRVSGEYQIPEISDEE